MTKVEKLSVPDPVSILMPVYNEAEVLENVVEEWITDVIQFLPEGSELLIADGASTDGTRDILKRLSLKHSFIRVIYRDSKEGFGAAARVLYREARCPWIFFTDSDGQYVPAEFWKLVPFMGQFPFIHGAKVGRQDPLFRKVASAVFNRIARLLFDVHCDDINSAFRIMRAELVKELLPQLTCMQNFLNTELLIRANLHNYPIKQVDVMHRSRDGESRSLPARRVLKEGLAAYRGLWELRSQNKK